MNPKTKLQKKAVALSAKLRPITAVQEQWAYDSCLEYCARRVRKTLHCLECGHSWKDGAILVSALTGCVCPSCGKDLKIYEEPNQSAYFAIIKAIEGVQVVRMFWVQKNYYKKSLPIPWTSEVMQHFVFPDGEVVTLMKKVSGLTSYFDSWVWDSELKVRKSGSYRYKMRCTVRPFKIYPERTIIPELKRNGFAGHFYGFVPHKFMASLLGSPAFEILLKSKQIALLKHFDESSRMQKNWPSIRICIRNGYIVQDASMWEDYMDLLLHFGKDVHNPKYICPIDLRDAHDRLVRKKLAIDRKQKIAEKRKRLVDEQVDYAREKGRFFGIAIQDGDIKIKTIESVEELMKEGDELKHCVFANDYHKKSESLIMSARVNDKPVETIEVSLKDFSVIQARGQNNKPTAYHNQILDIFNNNKHCIIERVR